MEHIPVNLDAIVNYRDEYTAALRVTGDKERELFALCPFHTEKTGSFHVNLTTDQFRCFGCGEQGNFVDCCAKLHGVNTKEACREILRRHGVNPDESAQKTRQSPTYPTPWRTTVASAPPNNPALPDAPNAFVFESTAAESAAQSAEIVL